MYCLFKPNDSVHCQIIYVIHVIQDMQDAELEKTMYIAGAIQDFKLGGGGAHLKKLRRAEGGAEIVGVFRVKNHDFTPKKDIFPILGGRREIFGVFHVKNHDFTPKKILFLPILGGGGANPPLYCFDDTWLHVYCN